LCQRQFDAVLLDLDGVLTRTAAVHARAWKRMFDEYLQQRSGSAPWEPFNIERDYRGYVDGKPREEGVRDFLETRNIHLPCGQPHDEPVRETIGGLGNRKNQFFHELLEREGVEVWEESVERVRQWRQQGVKTAVVSSSRNCAAVLKTARIEDLADARVDGIELARCKLRGKPEPDIFLEAARRLDVEPARAVVVEDAVAGVQAGRAGGFGLVVGIGSQKNAKRLLDNGADVVVESLDRLDLPMEDADMLNFRRPRYLLDSLQTFFHTLAGKRLALFLDYDGTLTPIVPRPEDALMSEDMRRAVQELAGRCTVAIVSGRDLADVKQFVQLDELFYAGRHGYDIVGPDGTRMQHEGGKACLTDLDRAEHALRKRIEPIPGSQVERKRFAIAVHYRNVLPQEVPRIERVVDEVHEAHPRLRKRGGKKVFELQPDIEWDKGKAVQWLSEQLGLDVPDVVRIYVGDDVTDEDAFRVLTSDGIGIRVGEPSEATCATYLLRDTDEVKTFLLGLNEFLQ